MPRAQIEGGIQKYSSVRERRALLEEVLSTRRRTKEISVSLSYVDKKAQVNRMK